MRALSGLLPLLASVMLLAAAPLQNAPAATQEQPVVLRSTSRLVEVNVLALDGQGNPVVDLKPQEWTVQENDVPQPVRFVSLTRAGQMAAPGVPAPPVGVHSNQLGEGRDLPSSAVAIVLDGLNTSWADQTLVKQQLAERLRQLQPTDRVAVFTLGRSLRVLHDMRSDTPALLSRLQRFTGETGFSANSFYNGVGQAQEVPFRTTNRALNTLWAVESIAHYMAGLPGRKSLVWISNSFPLATGSPERALPPEAVRVLRAVSDAALAVYPVAVDSANGAQAPSEQAMSQLAEQTGGKPFPKGNSVAEAITTALSDSRSAYTLGYLPSNAALDGSFRQVQVSVKRPGVSLHYRNGYYAPGESTQRGMERRDALQTAVWSPLDATGIAMAVRVGTAAEPQPNSLAIAVQIDPRTVSFQSENGRWLANLDVSFVQRDRDGRSVDGVSDVLHMRLQQKTYDTARQQGLLYRRTVPRLGEYLTVIVRDAPAGAVGSLTFRLAP